MPAEEGMPTEGIWPARAICSASRLTRASSNPNELMPGQPRRKPAATVSTRSNPTHSGQAGRSACCRFSEVAIAATIGWPWHRGNRMPMQAGQSGRVGSTHEIRCSSPVGGVPSQARAPAPSLFARASSGRSAMNCRTASSVGRPERPPNRVALSAATAEEKRIASCWSMPLAMA